MPDPLVVEVMNEFRAELALREAASMNAMARQWNNVQDALQGSIDALAERLATLAAAGQTVTRAQLLQLDAYKRMLAQARTEIARYERYAAGQVEAGQTAGGQLGIEAAQAGIAACYTQNRTAVASFKRLPIEAVEYMVGLTADGSPVSDLLRQAWPEASLRLTDELVRAIALGRNPRQTAGAMSHGLDGALDRMLRITRTEQNRAFRNLNRQQMIESGVVRAYKRLAARKPNTCIACLLADGQEYDLDVDFEEHPVGRCTLVPVVKNLPERRWQTGHDWFLEQDAAVQRAMMGGGRYDAWKDGQFDLLDIIARRTDTTWGNALVPASLAALASG